LYLRYRNSTLQHMKEMIKAIVENRLSHQVLKSLRILWN
jgi:hypothetical protein